MSEDNEQKKSHFFLGNLAKSEPFRPKGRPNPSTIPARERQQHGNKLLGQIQQLKPVMDQARKVQESLGLEPDGIGLRIEFEPFDDVELAFESLAREGSGIELFNIRKDEEQTYATVFVPDGKLVHFESLITDYLNEKKDKNEKLRDHHKLINTIKEIHEASLKALWTDDESLFPQQDDESFWWEVWLPRRKDRQKEVNTFKTLAKLQDMEIARSILEFPERTVLHVKTSKHQMQQSMMMLNSIAELRRAKETADFFDGLPPGEQPEWVNELLERCKYKQPDSTVPHICLLDTGVNPMHPLISPALDRNDLHTVEPAWGKDDQHGHGTAMAGVVLFGDLTEPLSSSLPVNIHHRLESVKLLSHQGSNGGDAELHGYLTQEAVNRVIVTDAIRCRVFGMAVSARDARDRGRPSAWSSAVDSLAVDADGENEQPQLIILCAGNIEDPNAWREYPASNSSDGIHDPGQAWNALTVGAFTDLFHITEDDAQSYSLIAPAGGLSPFSTTSATWQKEPWPLKPDVVFEGGNVADDGLGAVWLPSLSLLTTNHSPMDRLLTTINATSAATALACRMAARLMAEYPGLWPETIRALMVHSARWTDAMLQAYLPIGREPNKADYLWLVRHCGFGVPDLNRALWSLSNSLTMVIESELYPFKKTGSTPSLREMNLHQLPWPLDELESLGETEVEMRVTLSYFIEPNPSSRGARSRYRYESHGLRFDVKRPLESENDFRGRINLLAINEDNINRRSGDDTGWLIGTQNRHKGSLHSDIWKGPAAELASRGVLAVFPTLGWWKTRTALARYNKKTRYALIISIHAPATDIDLYAAVKNQISTPVTIGTGL